MVHGAVEDPYLEPFQVHPEGKIPPLPVLSGCTGCCAEAFTLKVGETSKKVVEVVLVCRGYSATLVA